MRATTTVTTSSPPSWRITSAITPEPWARPDSGPVRDAHGRSCEPGNHRARGAIRLPERGAGFDPPVPRRSPAGPHYAQRLEAVRHLAEQRPPVAGGAWDAELEARLLDRGGARGGLAQAHGDARDVCEDG